MDDSQSKEKALSEENKEPRDAIETAMGLLSYKEWTESAMAERLAKRGCDEAGISEAMAWLKEQGLIDDKKYAEAFASERMRTRRWGLIKLSAELKKRGIGSELIEDAIAPLKGDAEENTALSAFQKWLRIKREELPLSRELKIKAMNHLRSKGFTGQAVSFAVNAEENEDQY